MVCAWARISVSASVAVSDSSAEQRDHPRHRHIGLVGGAALFVLLLLLPPPGGPRGCLVGRRGRRGFRPPPRRRPAESNAMYHSVESIVTDTPHTATGEEGLLVMEILDAARRSAATGEAVSLE